MDGCVLTKTRLGTTLQRKSAEPIPSGDGHFFNRTTRTNDCRSNRRRPLGCVPVSPPNKRSPDHVHVLALDRRASHRLDGVLLS